MGFFNDLGKKTTETTSKIAREAKLKMKMKEKELVNMHVKVFKNILVIMLIKCG